jgi:hypothetical protein
MRVNELPDSPFATDNGATKIGVGLCRSQPRKSKWIANEMLSDAAWRFGAAGWSCENIGHYGLGSLYSTHSFAKMKKQSHHCDATQLQWFASILRQLELT